MPSHRSGHDRAILLPFTAYCYLLKEHENWIENKERMKKKAESRFHAKSRRMQRHTLMAEKIAETNAEKDE